MAMANDMQVPLHDSRQRPNWCTWQSNWKQATPWPDKEPTEQMLRMIPDSHVWWVGGQAARLAYTGMQAWGQWAALGWAVLHPDQSRFGCNLDPHWLQCLVRSWPILERTGLGWPKTT